jgi:hypothetical protein
MDKLELNSQLGGSTTKAKSQLDHIWANVLENECKLGATKIYLIFTNQFILYSNYLTHSQCITKKTINISIYSKHNICDYMCEYMMHFPFGHPKIISSSIISKCCIIYCM